MQKQIRELERSLGKILKERGARVIRIERRRKHYRVVIGTETDSRFYTMSTSATCPRSNANLIALIRRDFPK